MLKAERGLVFAVRRMEIDFLAPARFEDALTVTTDFLSLRGARFELAQTVWRGGLRLFEASVEVVCMTGEGAGGADPGGYPPKAGAERGVIPPVRLSLAFALPSC